MNNYKRVHLIEVKYLGATNTRGSRVKVSSLRFNDSVTIPYDYSYNNIAEIFEAWLKELNNDLGIVSVGYNEKTGAYIYGVNAFEPMRNIKNGKEWRGISITAHNKAKRPCTANDLILVKEGLQCGNCLAVNP